MVAVVQIYCGSWSSLGALRGDYCPCKKRPGASCLSFSKRKLASLHPPSCLNLRLGSPGASRWCFLEKEGCRGVILVGRGMDKKKKKRVVPVRFNNQDRFGFNGGGGGKDDGATARVVGNLALAIGFTYLVMSGQLGWVLDTVVSIWLLAVILPFIGLGAFLWWAGRDIVQSTCPNCGNDFQVFKSSLNDELQSCPFCSQPFSVLDGKFVKEAAKSSNEFSSKTRAADEFKHRPRKGKDSSRAIVDVEAEVKDVD
ncbi:hypothetical protein SAY87_031702 [Trapa incisa]|uniref:Uncharacterized protein n=1 Tax=Trapa incisa TaxID=236973 RepID=A0AAN7QQ23_9MYRT|nr:hypothetical protein SAY87_031702 [Trapa incisa]